MSTIPAELRFAESHEWAKQEGDLIVVGISDHAQEALGDVVFVELPEVGKVFSAPGDQAGVVESVKAASDIYSPVAGEVVEVNEALSGEPEALNNSPYDSWIFKVKPANAADLDKLLDAAGYKALIAE
ncbi:glycine cleavage system protein GcvH [Pseudomonas sp. W2Oct36]|uniref:glycine cleavage system protein GcvH n=1 Tax=unclassified Pseudomonas TaxID=196821 RepID=UPI000C132438|nr:glycine cleavage system protein GcvH [Pseudomonas sp.]PHX38622.1 glycine cleavage system protein H [Pseudomonas sp. NZIPFR-PS5]RZI73875.1 MAG: glycine cleavage system protein GcvH [Pseudomonas sp.]